MSMDPEPGDTIEMDRLHPFTLAHRLIISLPALLVILLPVLRGADTNTWIMMTIVVIYGISVVPLVLLQYLRFRYAVTPEEIVIHSGVFTYKHRNIPVERIQNIEIEQSLLPRFLGLAKVKIETAGSRTTEGVIEFVDLERARAIRETVRALQRAKSEDASVDPEDVGLLTSPERPSEFVNEQHLPAEAPRIGEERRRIGAEEKLSPAHRPRTTSPPPHVLHTMPLGRVLLSGVFRFSLLYIAMIFTLTEYLGLEPDEVARWLSGNRLEAFNELLRTSPILIVFTTIFVVGSLAWITGILTNLNRFYGFRIEYEDDKLHIKHGLLTVSEGTIPLKKIQAVIIRTNPMMRAFGWYRLELQTMGFDPNDRGYRVAAPFARLDEVLAIARVIRPFTLPEAFKPVSKLMIRRAFFRYTFGLMVITAVSTYFWTWGPWLLLATPLLYAFADQQYRNHGFDVRESHLFVRRGVFRRHTWVLPFERFQVFYLTQTLFQRRLGLQSLYVDTPGSAAMAHPVIVDLPEAEAQLRFEALYQDFEVLFSNSAHTIQ